MIWCCYRDSIIHQLVGQFTYTKLCLFVIRISTMSFFKKRTLLITLLVHLGVYCDATNVPCGRYQFQCGSGECINMMSLCNGQVNCNDESDENKCNSENPPKCGKYFFQCVSDKSCILHSWICDEEDDCNDGSDEWNCKTTPVCRDPEFECLKNKECIPMTTRCDGKMDCQDGSDELLCNRYSHNCDNRGMSCGEDSRCIPRAWLCDGDPDCEAGSDEQHCDSISSPSTTTASRLTETTDQSCPDNYCMQNADCVVIKGQYYCNCSPSFTGEKCEMRVTVKQNFRDLGIVIGISMTLIILLISIALMLFYYCKRRSSRYSTALMSKSEGTMPFTSYSKE